MHGGKGNGGNIKSAISTNFETLKIVFVGVRRFKILKLLLSLYILFEYVTGNIIEFFLKIRLVINFLIKNKKDRYRLMKN